MNGNAALRAAAALLAAAGIDSATRDARALLAFAKGIAADRLTLHLPEDLTPAEVAAFDAAVAARLARQPVSQITGQRLFWGRQFKVTSDTLDPRPETEILVAEALTRPFDTILDLGTGTGCILLSCLAEMPMARGVGCDISDKALVVASENAESMGLTSRVRLLRSDWFSGIVGQFDLIASNPPYIAQSEMACLAPDVLNWEPHLALSPGGDGLAAYRAIAKGAKARLAPAGRLLLEIGPTQAAAVCGLLCAEGFANVRVLRDLDGRDRVIAVETALSKGAD